MTAAGVGTVMVTLAMAGCSPGAPSSGVPETPAPVSLTPLAGEVTDRTNAERTRAGLQAVRADSALTEAAQIQAGQMARAGRLDHDLPGATYPRLEDRLRAAGYTWRAAAENIAYGQAGAAAVMADWMRSPAHRENILNPAFTEIGVGHADDPGGRHYFVQVFARPP